MKRDDFSLPLAFPGDLIVDNFASGGRQRNLLDAEEHMATGCKSSYGFRDQGAPT